MSYQGFLSTAQLSHPGLVRDHNEDYIAVDKELGIVTLADGMGGYQAGEIASEIAVTQIMQEVKAKAHTLELGEVDGKSDYHHASLLLQQAVLKANQAIYQSAQAQPEFYGMGTTVVAALFYEAYLSIGHVGDSRLYRLRDGQLQQLTKDHSVLQELVDHGFYTPEQARHSPNKNLVTRALGVNLDVKVDLMEVPVNVGDLFLLCSDGLNDMLDDQQILEQLETHFSNLDKMAEGLVQAANAQGGDDNISVILVQALGEKQQHLKTWWRKWWRW